LQRPGDGAEKPFLSCTAVSIAETQAQRGEVGTSEKGKKKRATAVQCQIAPAQRAATGLTAGKGLAAKRPGDASRLGQAGQALQSIQHCIIRPGLRPVHDVPGNRSCRPRLGSLLVRVRNETQPKARQHGSSERRQISPGQNATDVYQAFRTVSAQRLPLRLPRLIVCLAAWAVLEQLSTNRKST